MNDLLTHLAREVAALRAEIERLKAQEAGNLLRSGGTLTGVLLLPDGSTSAPAMGFSADTNVGIYRYGTDRLGLVTAGAIRLAINDNGRVGINTTGQAATLQVHADAAGTSALIIRSAASPTVDTLRSQNSAGTTQFAVGNDGKLKTNQGTSNTNTPSGATAQQLAVYDTAGTLLGYIPVYGSAW